MIQRERLMRLRECANKDIPLKPNRSSAILIELLDEIAALEKRLEAAEAVVEAARNTVSIRLMIRPYEYPRSSSSDNGLSEKLALAIESYDQLQENK